MMSVFFPKGCLGEGDMVGYAAGVERLMTRLFGSLKEGDRRRYAAIEAAKLGHGGIEYLATLLGCDPKTIRQGQHDLDQLPDDLGKRVRKKGAGGSGAETPPRSWSRTSCACSGIARRVIRCGKRCGGPTCPMS